MVARTAILVFLAMSALTDLRDQIVHDVGLLIGRHRAGMTLGEPEPEGADDHLELEDVEPRQSYRRPDTATPMLDVFGDSHVPTGSPLVEGRLTSSFGWRVHPISKKKKHHDGEDIAAPIGTPVMATAAGVVRFAGSRSGYGHTIEIDHGNGFVTRYAHLRDLSVEAGQDVERGETIGTVGMTGRTTGPHLHYEVIRNGRPQNPHPFVVAKAP
jgi:murein DD-endopeptidase MepM/ murein hydrolase activator NlpD